MTTAATALPTELRPERVEIEPRHLSVTLRQSPGGVEETKRRQACPDKCYPG